MTHGIALRIGQAALFRTARFRLIAFVLAAGVAASGSAAEQLEFRKITGEFSVYLAVMPVELIAGPQLAPVPGATPYQPPAAKDTHHVMVSIFEYQSGRRVAAAVAARVAPLGFSGLRKTLEPTAVGSAQVFANTFPMIGRGPFRVDVEFLASNTQKPGRARFYFTHPSFAPPKHEASREAKQ